MFDNLVAFSAIFIASIFMKYLAGFDAEVGSYIYLPIGAKILIFLLFGRRVLPGVMASCIFCGVVLFNSWGGNFYWGATGAIMGAISPLISIWTLEKLKVSDFSNLKKIDFKHVLFLIFFTAIIHALSKFIIYAKSDVFSVNPVDFLSHYLVGDMLGGIVVIWTVLKILPYFVTRALAKP
ncbi:MAG: MASE1 domain-containing protein [Candidatus Thioglobus sp.]|nr:MASE1 domain-containing protein [Candidatus Thioglobus sp.]